MGDEPLLLLVEWVDASGTRRCRSGERCCQPSCTSALCCAVLVQGGKRLDDVGVLTFRNNYALQQSFGGMPERWVSRTRGQRQVADGPLHHTVCSSSRI